MLSYVYIVLPKNFPLMISQLMKGSAHVVLW